MASLPNSKYHQAQTKAVAPDKQLLNLASAEIKTE